MRASFILPSCNYNITITEDELQQLLQTGHIAVETRRVPCKTGRTIYDGSKKTFKTLDSREIPNDLQFSLDAPVADIEDRDWHVQFMTINVEKRRKPHDLRSQSKIQQQPQLYCYRRR